MTILQAFFTRLNITWAHLWTRLQTAIITVLVTVRLSDFPKGFHCSRPIRLCSADHLASKSSYGRYAPGDFSQPIDKFGALHYEGTSYSNDWLGFMFLFSCTDGCKTRTSRLPFSNIRRHIGRIKRSASLPFVAFWWRRIWQIDHPSQNWYLITIWTM